ncbi:ATP-binding cassette sub-family A member 3 [Araneus ventricosus]|uniref:ATP-binding cassette sub-family A member 3 n=1 Tax=Araneus ventricosus TaxID=182803 RepID=A0A4Y2F7Z1_ARAVE|nr:ATP-binding cassette sub-family A member 3 [Araneus ventricosus]
MNQQITRSDRKVRWSNVYDSVIIFLQKFPYPGYNRTLFSTTYRSFDENFIYLGLVFFVLTIVKRIIEEKNDGSKELMESMGMTKFPYWASTFTSNFITAFIIVLVITIIYKTSAKNTVFHIQTDFLLLFVILLLFMASLILFCMTISIFFNRVAFALIAVLVVHLLSYLLLESRINYGMELHEDYFALSLFHKLCICIYPGGALLTSFFIMRLFEFGNVGVQWKNLTKYPMIPDINMLMVIEMMIFSCFLYTLVIWYFDAVWPWQPGVRKPFYFFLTKSYWFGEKLAAPNEIELVSSANSVENFEAEPRNVVRSVVIKDLSKVIQQGRSSKVLLRDVSLKCYQGQITTLLGHSEAEKTSLINILAGKELPIKGSASIIGLDISTNRTRKFVGVCPQHDVLYDELSVEQHLKIYAAIKGTSLGRLTYEAEQVLNSLKLSSKKAEMVSNLSYADKRKLSLAIAIIGRSKVLLLDEPTYGMDDEAKRHVWDALLAVKHDRTVIVTTQSCEEADILGDRIAVMVEGEIQSCGTPAFIKQRLGPGYHLHVLKDASFDLNGLKSLITKHVSIVTCENETLKEVSFNLGSADELGGFFKELESRKTDLGIISYGVSLSTIRDVLLTVSNLSLAKQGLQAGVATEITSTKAEDVSRDSFHPALHASLDNQFRALLLKHFRCSKRRWKFHIIQLAVPFILMLICFYCIKSANESRNQPLKLDISSVYGTTDGFYYNNDQSLSDMSETFKNVLELNDVSAEKVSEPTYYVLNYGEKSLAKYLKRLVVGGTIDRFPSGRLHLTAWHNSGSIHSVPMSLLLMQTALLRHITRSDSSISLTIVPLISVSEKYSKIIFSGFSTQFVSFFLPLALTFLSVSFILAPMHERATKSKLLQLMSGIPTAMYWTSMFLWDYLIYFVICIFLIMAPAVFFPFVFFGVHPESIGTLLVLFLLYGWASLPLGYIVSILFKRENHGLSIFIGASALFSFVCIALLKEIIPLLYWSNREVPYGILDAYWFFRLFPLYSISMGAQINFQIASNNAACDIFTSKDLARCESASSSSSPTLFRCCKDICKDVRCHETMNHFSMKNYESYFSNGPEALFLGLEGIICFAILFLLETRTATIFLSKINLLLQSMWGKIIRNVLRKGNQVLRNENIIDDPQVLQEEERIRNLTATQQGSGGEALVVFGLTKKYGNFSAVNRLTFGVNREEYFGVLGVKGAGKTSTFRMLTCDDLPSEGNAFIQSYSLIGDFRKFRSHIGYCPEVDSLVDDLTGREMLMLFGQLRGLRGYDLQNKVNELIQSMGLTNCADELTQFYSGGNKRKLSVAIALVGSPPVILLDEPTARVGPESRRQIWRVLTRVRKRTGASILLATQSAEESKALCNRLAILVNGRFCRLGSVEQLKSKNGQGYSLTIKISKENQNNAETVYALKRHMENSLKNATLTDDYQGKLQYHVVNPSITIGHLFQFLSDAKAQFELEDYSIAAISQEQIFHACSRA